MDSLDKYSNMTYIKPGRKTQVVFNRNAEKDARKTPHIILHALSNWIELVKKIGLREVRKIKGYHDEPLYGNRKGQRSIRLNRSYRAIYQVTEDGDIELITIIEINKHKY